MKSSFRALGLGCALFVTTATVVAAIRGGSFAPLWQAAWLPAVIVAAFSSPSRRCRR